MINLENKVAVVTGGASGIGEATVKTMARLGASVVIGDVNMQHAEALAAELNGAGYKALAWPADVTDEAQISSLMEAAVSKFGGLDILHNCAGIPRTIAPDCEVIEMTLDWWNKTIAGHLTGTMLGCKYALPHMIARGGGAIVNTSSSAGFSATVNQAAYSAAKAGVHQLTREVAATYGRDNIRCNAVVPGLVLTPRGRATFTQEMIDLFATETPLPRLALAQDLANAVIFLASDEAGMITGQTLSVDGGFMIKLPYWSLKMRASRGERFDTTTFKIDDVPQTNSKEKIV
jgi:NAD(P)-dependent dehydrogenase (short-subunit alcohol dehydrogenase family)